MKQDGSRLTGWVRRVRLQFVVHILWEEGVVGRGLVNVLRIEVISGVRLDSSCVGTRSGSSVGRKQDV